MKFNSKEYDKCHLNNLHYSLKKYLQKRYYEYKEKNGGKKYESDSSKN